MGSKSSKSKKTETSSTLGKEINCPYCDKIFNKNTTFYQLNDHIMNCANKSGGVNKDLKNIEKTPNIPKFVSEITKFEKDNNENSKRDKDFSQIFQKNVPDINLIYNQNSTKNGIEGIKEKKIILKQYDENLYASLIQTARKKEFISNDSFETKFSNLRSCLEEIKIDWREAHCNLLISRENILEDTLKKLGSTDPYKVYY